MALAIACEAMALPPAVGELSQSYRRRPIVGQGAVNSLKMLPATGEASNDILASHVCLLHTSHPRSANLGETFRKTIMRSAGAVFRSRLAIEMVRSFVKGTSPARMPPGYVGANLTKNRRDCEHSFGTLAEFLGQGWRRSLASSGAGHAPPDGVG